MYQRPPRLVCAVMHAICVLFGVDSTWNQAKILLTDIHFISNMLDYDVEHVPFEVP